MQRKSLTKWKAYRMGSKIYTHMTDKKLICKIHKQLIKQYKKTQNSIKNMQKTWIDIFLDIQMTNKHMKRGSTMLITREMQIKATKRYHIVPVGMTFIKKTTND